MKIEDEYQRHMAYVDVLGGELWIAEDADGRLYFPVKPSCGYLGIDFDSSLDAIKADSRLAPGLRQIKLPTTGGPQAQQCLRKLEYTWWLSVLDPRRFRPERRPRIIERQRILMEIAEDAILRRGELRTIRSELRQRAASTIEAQGSVEAHLRCLKCGAPHIVVLDAAGWHLHLGVEVEV